MEGLEASTVFKEKYKRRSESSFLEKSREESGPKGERSSSCRRRKSITMPPLEGRKLGRRRCSITLSGSNALNVSSPEESEMPLKTILSKLRSHAFHKFTEGGSEYEEVLRSVGSRAKNLPPAKRKRILASFGFLMNYAEVKLSPSITNLTRLATAFGYWDFLVDRYPAKSPIELGPIYLASMPNSVKERTRIRQQVLRKSGLPHNIGKLSLIMM
jgi:hypothetical protein